MPENTNVKDGQQQSTFKNDTVKKFAANLESKAQGKPIRRIVGANGFACGDVIKCKGTISIQDVTNAAGEKTAEYLAVDTERGAVSLKSLMGLSSLRGYQISGILENEYEDADGHKQVDQITAEVMPGMDFAKIWQPETRDYLALADTCAENSYFENMYLLHVGTVARKFKSKQDSDDFNHENAKVRKGFNRVMTAKLWCVGKKAEIEAIVAEFKRNATRAAETPTE